MIAYFNEGKFVGWWHNQPDETNLKQRIATSLGHQIGDVKMYNFPVALRNDQSYQFQQKENGMALQLIRINREEIIEAESETPKILTSISIEEEIVAQEI